MKKIVKVLSYLFLGFLLLLGALALAVKMYVTPERVKTFVEKNVSEKIHRQVKLGGISVGLFSGLAISDFSLSEYPDFSKGTFISSERFQLVPQLLPLLKKQLFVDELVLVKPQVKVVRLADGKTFNFSNLTSSSPSNAPSSASPSPFTFLVSKIILESGRLDFVDQSPAAQSTQIDALNVNVRNVSLVAPVDATIDFKVKTKGIDAAVDFSGSIWALKGSAKIKQLGLKSGGSSLKLSGDVNEVTGKNPLFDIKLIIEKLEPSLLTSLGAMPASVHLKDSLSGELTAKGSMSSVVTIFNLLLGPLTLNGKGNINKPSEPSRSFDMNIKSNEFPIGYLMALAPADSLPKEAKLSGPMQLSMNVKGTSDAGVMDLSVEGKNLDVAYGTNFKKAAGVPFSMTLNSLYKVPLVLDMKSIGMNLSQLKLDGNGTYKSLKDKGVYALNLKTNTFPLEDLVPMVPPMGGYGLKGKASTTMKVVSAAAGPDVKGKAQLSDASLDYTGVKMAGIASSIDYTLDDASGKLTADTITHDYFSGSKLELTWNLTNVADMAKIAGPASLKVGKGNFKNIQKLTNDFKVAKILFMPITLLQKVPKLAGAVKLPDFNNIAYQEILGDYQMKAGVMTISKFELIGTDVYAFMKGTMGLVGAQPVNLEATMKVAAGMIGGTVGQLLNDAEGRTTLKMKITGPLLDPQVKLDMADTSKKAIEVIKEKLGDKPQEQIEKLLKGLFKK